MFTRQLTILSLFSQISGSGGAPNAAPEVQPTYSLQEIYRLGNKEFQSYLDNLKPQDRGRLLSEVRNDTNEKGYAYNRDNGIRETNKQDQDRSNRNAAILKAAMDRRQVSTEEAKKTPAAQTSEGQQAEKELDDGTQIVKKTTQEKTIKHQEVVGQNVQVIKPEKKTTRLRGTIETEGGEITPSSMINIIADLDGDSKVESRNTSWWGRNILGKGEQKHLIGELQLKKVLTQYANDKGLLNNLVGRIGSPELPWNQVNVDARTLTKNPQIQQFREDLIDTATALNVTLGIIVGEERANTGLTAIIRGETDALKAHFQNPENLEKFQTEIVKYKPQVIERILGALVKIGIMLPITVLSNGVVSGFIESKDITVDGEKGGFGIKKGIGESGSVAASINAIGAKLEGNFNDPARRTVYRTQQFIKDIEGDKFNKKDIKKAIKARTAHATGEKLNPQETAKIKALAVRYEKVQNAILDDNAIDNPNEEQKAALKNALVQNTLYFHGKVEEAKGVQLKGLFIGLGMTGVSVGASASKVHATATMRGNIAHARAGAEINKNTITLEQKKTMLNTGNMTYVENDDGSHTLTIRDFKLTPDLQAIKGSGHMEEISGSAIITIGTDEKLIINPTTIIMTDGSKRIYHNFKVISKNASQDASETPSPSELTKVKNALEGRDTLKELGNRIYRMSRQAQKHQTFSNILVNIGKGEFNHAIDGLKESNNSDIKAIITQLGGMDKIKGNPAKLRFINTFTYGALGMHKNTFSKNEYKQAHTRAVIQAENKLISYSTDFEDDFKKVDRHEPTPLSKLYIGQPLAVSVYATPKGGKHRIDQYEGSITVSQKTIPINNDAAKDAILRRHERTTQKYLNDLNQSLPENSRITLNDYNEWIKTGTKPAKLKNYKIAGTDKTGIYEARAMIHGNLCANKTEVIVYPVLKGQSIQTVQDNESVENYGDYLATKKVSQATVGIAAGKRKTEQKKPKEDPKPTPKPKPTPTTTPHPRDMVGGGASSHTAGKVTTGVADNAKNAVTQANVVSKAVVQETAKKTVTNAASGRAAAVAAKT